MKTYETVIGLEIHVELKTKTKLFCDISEVSQFDRKNYLYPDNPQGYQITQFYNPLCRNGFLTVRTETGEKSFRVHEIHLEDDAGKLSFSPEHLGELILLTENGEINGTADFLLNKERLPREGKPFLMFLAYTTAPPFPLSFAPR